MAVNTVVRTNIQAKTAYRNLTSVGNAQTKASARLSSGKKINSAADDAAGLAISDKMTAQIRGLDMAYKNSQDAISMIQTAEGSVSEINNMVQRIRELAVQSANATNTTEDRNKLQTEVAELMSEINLMAGRTEFNELKLNTTNSFDFQIGANANQTITLNGEKFDCAALSLTGDISTAANAQTMIDTCDNALKSITTYRATLGALQNRLEYTASNLQVSSENLSSARSRIEDADMAKEMMNFTSANILQQAATSMLAQGNQAPNSVLQLLG